MENVCLLIGNGFTLDFCLPHGLHSSKPLRTFNTSEISYTAFLDKLPSIQQELYPFAKNTDDYDAIERFLQKNRGNIEKECELRRFFALAYSLFQLTAENYNMKGWRWADWLQKNREKIICAVSFNYDCILERALSLANIPFHRVGTTEPRRGIPILKPHGSIDFDVEVNGHSAEKRWGITKGLSDTDQLEIVPKTDWMKPRMEANIIPPSIYNIQLKLSWVNAMYNIFDYVTTKRNDIDNFIMVGHSYAEMDRPEVNFFLERLNKGTNVYIINPNPNETLIEKVHALHLPLKQPNREGMPW
ncbi:hypothetical protein WD019_20625 [Fictibacillus sp. Mic-4]|uniref:hypothetical protein n=1 Tax=Fictibacillus sp. Mic-4 TaxID=3132826 RepID=UPI003CEB0390